MYKRQDSSDSFLVLLARVHRVHPVAGTLMDKAIAGERERKNPVGTVLHSFTFVFSICYELIQLCYKLKEICYNQKEIR